MEKNKKEHCGDDGTTCFIGPGRLPKCDLRIETLGTLDEASAAIGVAKACVEPPIIKDKLTHIQRDLYRLMSEVATDPEVETGLKKIDRDALDWLDDEIEAMETQIKCPEGFIVPGDTIGGAHLDLARVTVRRAERCLVLLSTDGGVRNHWLLCYLNRLSTTLFVMELYLNYLSSEPGFTLARQDE
jgi:cob(I)alamin adenosyltransferase